MSGEPTPAASRARKAGNHRCRGNRSEGGAAGRGPAGRGARDDDPVREAVLRIHRRLEDEYGTPEQGERLDPLEEVVFTILSQNTTDTNRDRAWESMWATFDDWDDVASAPEDELAEAIQPGGLHRTKAKRIQALLEQVREERGAYDLDHLASAPMEEARRDLSRFKGMGAKSVNCVLLFSLGRPAFPVDTHVHRILRRVGVLETGDLTRANRKMQELVPDELSYPLHVNLIRHGRRICHARGPRCRECAIEDLCGYEDKRLDPE